MDARIHLLSLAALGVTIVCAKPGASGRTRSAERVDRTVLTREQMLTGRYATVYDAVAAQRSMWLRPRGPESFVLPTEVWVYLDNARLGTVEVLRNIQPNLVTTVRFYDGPAATGRWGLGHGAGVIHVSTWSGGALGFPRTDDSTRTDGTRSDSARADSARPPRRPDAAPGTTP